MTRSSKAFTPAVVFGITELQRSMPSVFPTCFLWSCKVIQVMHDYRSGVTFPFLPHLRMVQEEGESRSTYISLALGISCDSEGQSSLPSQ